MEWNTLSSKIIRSIEDIKDKLNNLNHIKVNRREEEITKFLIKKIIRFAQKDGYDSKDKNLYKRYFDGVMDEKEFNDVFYSSKQFLNK